MVLKFCTLEGQKCFLELFSGAGHVAAVAAARGVPAFGLDRRQGWDLSQEEVQQCFLSFVRRGLIKAIMLDPPCESWSLARRGKRGPSQPVGFPCRVRSILCIWGLPLETLRPQDQAVLLNGNSCFLTCLALIRFCLVHGVPVAMENPASSMMWQVPELQELLGSAATPSTSGAASRHLAAMRHVSLGA